MKNLWISLFKAAQIAAYIMAIILIIQILRKLFGGSWNVEDIILAFIVLNITLTFGVVGYLIQLNNRISKIDAKLHGHLEWHRGRDYQNI